MPGLVPGIHGFFSLTNNKPWMAGINPAMTKITTVIARLDRAINAIRRGTTATSVARHPHGMDGRVKRGHDGSVVGASALIQERADHVLLLEDAKRRSADAVAGGAAERSAAGEPQTQAIGFHAAREDGIAPPKLWRHERRQIELCHEAHLARVRRWRRVTAGHRR